MTWQLAISLLNNTAMIPPARRGRPIKFSMDDDNLKTCSKCHDDKPIDAYRYQSKVGRYKTQCIECENRIARERRRAG